MSNSVKPSDIVRKNVNMEVEEDSGGEGEIYACLDALPFAPTPVQKPVKEYRLTSRLTHRPFHDNLGIQRLRSLMVNPE